MRFHTLAWLLPFAALPAQTVIALGVGAANSHLGQTICAAGDVDGDGVPDFVVSEPYTTTSWGRCHLISGATHNELCSFQGSDPGNGGQGLGAIAINMIGDVDGDGHPDFAIGYSATGPLDVFSGATGSRLYRTGILAPVHPAVCGIGDFDGDGHPDYVAYLAVNSVWQIWVCSGTNGQPLSLLWNNAASPRWLINVGDLNGDGTPEVAAIEPSGAVRILDPRTGVIIRGFSPSLNASVGLADLDGDGTPELLTGSYAVHAYSLATGALIRTFPWSGNTFAVLGDVDGDGVDDVVMITGPDPILGHDVEIFSSATGNALTGWTYQAGLNFADAITAVGDVDGDGFPDFVIGSSGTSFWQLISGRPVGATLVQPVNCSGGPFPPQLGVTRPVLGSTLTIVGRDAPPGAPGALIASIMPTLPTNLGVTGCDAWIDMSSAVVLTWLPGTPTWQFGLPVPTVRTLACTQLAFQAVYLGTNGPLGYDLTNGIWARVGY
jgi:hypothetical protein